MTSSPALTSPTPQGMQSSQESSNSQSQQDQKQQSGPLEVGFQRSSRYARLTSRDVNDAIARNVAQPQVVPAQSRTSYANSSQNQGGINVPLNYITQTSISSAQAAPVNLNSSSSNFYNYTNSSTNAPLTSTNPTTYTVSQSQQVQKIAARGNDNSPTLVSLKPAETEYKSAFTPTHVSDNYKNYAAVNIGSTGNKANNAGNRTSSDYANVQLPLTSSSQYQSSKDSSGYPYQDSGSRDSSIKSAVAMPKPYKPMVFTQAKSSTPPVGQRKKQMEYVSVAVPFIASQPKSSGGYSSSSGGSQYHGGYSSSNNRSETPKSVKGTSNIDYVSKVIPTESKSDYYEMRSIPFDSSGPKRKSSYNEPVKASLERAPALPPRSYTTSAGGDYSQRRDAGMHYHHPSATPPIPLRSGYVRYTPTVSSLSEKPGYSLPSEPYHKSYSDRSLDAYFKEGSARYKFSPPSIENSFQPMYQSGSSGNAMNTSGSGSHLYQFTHPVVMSGSRPLTGGASGYRSPPTDTKNLGRTSSLRDRPATSKHHSTYTKY